MKTKNSREMLTDIAYVITHSVKVGELIHSTKFSIIAYKNSEI